MRPATRPRWLSGAPSSRATRHVVASRTLSVVSTGNNNSSRATRPRHPITTANPHVHFRQSSGQAQAGSKTGPLQHYDSLVEQGTLRKDDFQRSVTEKLQALHNAVAAYDPPDIPEPVEYANFLDKWRGIPASPTVPPIPPQVPKGIYLYGDVGCGKTMLMDLFYDTLPASVANSKRRVHFHAFMEDVHKRTHKMSQSHKPGQDVIVPIARQLAKEARVLCFDEFQVLDIVDAMILRRLFESLMGYGVVCVITSNRPPDDLYKNGIQRQSFVPCIHLIKDRFEVIDLDSGLDYRKIPRKTRKVYFSPINQETRDQLDHHYDDLVSGARVQHDHALTVWGRPLTIPESSPANGGVARFTFKELCARPLSASDYLEITRNFQHIFVTDIPQLTLDVRDQARRFIVFIDTCYESKTKLFCLSDPPILEVFSDKGGRSGEITDVMRSAMDDLGLSADEVGASSIFSSDEEIFAFARAISRLSEMGTQAWSDSVYYATQ